MDTTNKRSAADHAHGQPTESDACEACALRDSRREFLRDAAGVFAAIAAGLAVPGQARALVLGIATPSHVIGSEVSYPVPALDSVTIDRERELILVRHQAAVYAFRLSCPHQRTALKWREDDGRFQCPKHKSKYQPDGTFISGRATRGMDRYAIRRKGREIVADLSKVYLEDKDKAGWSAAVVRL